jgi:hypothetical protein
LNSASDPVVALKTLNRLRVAYILIGGLAGEVHGAEVGLAVVEICYERSSRNVRRLARALETLNAKPRRGETFESPLNPETIESGDYFKLETDAGPMDLAATPEGTQGFRDLDRRSGVYDLGEGLLLSVAALEDLIRIEKAGEWRHERPKLRLLAEAKQRVDQDDRASMT